MKILILGASGYLGGVVYAQCRELADCAVCGTTHTQPAVGLCQLDICDENATRELISSFAPDAVIWCLWSKINEMELTDAGLRPLLALLPPSVRFIYLSTSLSPQDNQNEETPPEPMSEGSRAGTHLADYVNGKILGEELVRKRPNHVILRPGQIYGFGARGEMDGRMIRVREAVSETGGMVRSANVRISVVHVEDLALSIVELLDSDFTGTLCVASDRPVSYYEFYQYLAAQIGIEPDKIEPEYENRQPGRWFDTAKAKALLRTKFRDIG